jgi:hypothetical protein
VYRALLGLLRLSPSHWECYDAFPEVSERFFILADWLDDLGEGQAAQHCRLGTFPGAP